MHRLLLASLSARGRVLHGCDSEEQARRRSGGRSRKRRSCARLPPEEPLPPMTDAPTFSAGRRRKPHSCGITESADLFCWGRNDQGQLGDSGTTERTLPRKWAVDSSGAR